MRFRRLLMRIVVAHREQAAMHLGVQGLHPSAHHLGKTGQVRDVAYCQADFGERRLGPAGGDQLDAAARELAGKIGESGLVRNGKERTANGAQMLGH